MTRTKRDQLEALEQRVRALEHGGRGLFWPIFAAVFLALACAGTVTVLLLRAWIET